jgi:hypothetical protein
MHKLVDYLSDHIVLGLNYFLRPTAPKSDVAPPGGAQFKNSKNG